jgi:hypothetical protein
LAGHSKDQLESVLLRGSWRAVESRAAGSTIDSVELIRADGETARDLMVVGGYAAETETRWDWCKSSVGKDQESGDEPAPHGPNLWWPSGPVFDPRAND